MLLERHICHGGSKMIVEGKHIYIYGKENTKAPLVIVNTFQGDGHEVYEAMQQIKSIPITLAVKYIFYQLKVL